MKLYLAPIHGVTIASHRNLYTELFQGIDACYAPFISTTHMRKRNAPLFRDILPENNSGAQNLVPQILGNNGADFRFFAATIANLGYKEINWNIGCPYPNITKKKKGSGLLPYPDEIKEFLDTVCADKSYDLTVKMRLGLNDTEEGLRVIELLNDYPLSGVIIHGRTGVQKYTGHVDLDAFETLYTASKHRVIYNGDILTRNDYQNVQKRFPQMTEFMLGRGALRNPFLPSMIKGVHLSKSEQFQVLQDYHQKTYDFYKANIINEHLFINKMKEFWTYTAGQIDENGAFLAKIRSCTTTKDYLLVCEQLFRL